MSEPSATTAPNQSPAPLRHKHRFTEERKQSASDLQSRLKTRKLLGVGELNGDNGDVYKSKISQLLGINESLYVRFPRGMFYWNALNTFYLVFLGLMCLLFPTYGYYLDTGIEQTDPEALHAVRLYGVALTAIGAFYKSSLHQRETRAEIATLLLLTAAFHMALMIASCIEKISCISICIRLFFLVGNLCYHSLVDGQGGLHRQLMRVFEDIWFMTSTPVVEKRPVVEVAEVPAVDATTAVEAADSESAAAEVPDAAEERSTDEPVFVASAEVGPSVEGPETTENNIPTDKKND